jgi:hypothetical protein
LQFVLRDSTGAIVYQARGGIQLTQQLSILTERNYSTISYKQNYTNLAPSELFKDPDRDVHAVDVALHELIFSPEEIAAQEAAKLKAASAKH